MAYTPNLPNAYDTSLIPVEVRAKYFEEVLLESPLTAFMGDSPEAVIQVVYKKDGTGSTTTFAFSREIDYKQSIYDYDQISGKAQQLKFYEDQITVRQRSMIDGLKGIQLTQLLTPIDIYSALKPKLVTAHKRNITFSLLNSATFGSYGPSLLNPTANYTVGPVANRVLYGNSTTNYNANMITAATALGAPTPAGDGPSVAAARQLRDIAVQGGITYGVEKRISPFMLKTRERFPEPMFVYFMSTASFRILEQDPDWKQYYYRGIIEMPNQPSGLSGAFFKGQIGDILFYEVPELGDFQLGTAQGFGGGGNNTATFAWNLFCGAQAFGLVWHKAPWFEQEFSNMRTVVEMAMLEFRGEKAIKFPSFQNEAVAIENGIIHHIVRTAAAS